MGFKKNDPNINRLGRPNGSISYKHKIQEAFLTIMETKVKVGKQTISYYDAFLQKLMADALSGDPRSRQFLAERLLEPGVLDTVDEYINKGRKSDEDFNRYRIHLLAHDVQREYLLTKQKRIYQMAGRRAGKSDGHILKAISVMQSKPNSKVLYIARTIGVGMDLMFNQLIKYSTDLGIDVLKEDRSDGYIQIENASEFFIKGNNNKASRENMRGGHYDLIIIDEAQSQESLSYLIQDICEPMLVDSAGTLVLSGTGPRIGGTFWEEVYINEEKYPGKRMNWNLTMNPYIKNYEHVLEEIMKEKSLTIDSPLFQREYLGKIVYDLDSLVFRLNENNFYTDDQFKTWCKSQPVTDVKLTAGLDLGFDDADGFCIIAFSTTKPEKFLLYQHKGRRQGIKELADHIKAGLDEYSYLGRPNIYTDTGGGGKKISYELNQQYGIPTMSAYKSNKDMGVELLQEEIRLGNFKLKRDTPFEDECLKTVFARNDKDELTRLIDHETYHGDLNDAILYAMRFYFINYSKSLFITKED